MDSVIVEVDRSRDHYRGRRRRSIRYCHVFCRRRATLNQVALDRATNVAPHGRSSIHVRSNRNGDWVGPCRESEQAISTMAFARSRHRPFGREHDQQLRPHSALADRTPASFASIYAASAQRFALTTTSKANEAPRQGFASPATTAALDSVPRLPQNLHYQGEALFKIAHTRDSLLSIWSELQAHESRSGEP
jgi:hypothetical protein